MIDKARGLAPYFEAIKLKVLHEIKASNKIIIRL